MLKGEVKKLENEIRALREEFKKLKGGEIGGYQVRVPGTVQVRTWHRIIPVRVQEYSYGFG